MNYPEILSAVGTVIGILGGGSVIALAISGWIGKIWADRLMKKYVHDHEKELLSIREKYLNELEILKVQLKKSEFIFEKQFAAASALTKYHEDLVPLAEYADMHMDDVFHSIMYEFADIEEWIKDFVSTFGAITPTPVAHELMTASRLSGEYKFDSGSDAIDSPAFKAAQKVYESIHMARNIMRDEVWEQASSGDR